MMKPTKKEIEPSYFTINQLCDLWQVCPDFVRRAIRRRDLAATRLGRTLRVPLSEVKRFAAEGLTTTQYEKSNIMKMTYEIFVEILNSAYLHGFMASGEGCNGEYPDWTDNDGNGGPQFYDWWVKKRDKTLGVLLNSITLGKAASENLNGLVIQILDENKNQG